jgi:hypothetical protein
MMMSNFHIGQKVVCVNVTPSSHPLAANKCHLLRKGDVYTIRDIDVRFASLHGDITIRLEEIRRPIQQPCKIPDWEPGFASRRFRPVRTTSIDIFTSMLAPTPRVKEPAE